MRFVLCDELVICVVSLGTGTVPHPWSARKPLKPSLQKVLLRTHEALTEPFKEDFWSIQEMPQKSSLNGSVNASPFSQTISWNVFPRAKISRSAMCHFFHSLNTPNRSIPVGAYAGVAGLVSARSFATNKNTSQNSSMNVHV